MITLGLTCIILGWALQFVFLLNGEKQISWLFVLCYTVGVFLLVADGYISGNIEIANMNLLSVILSTCVMLLLVKKERPSSSHRKRR